MSRGYFIVFCVLIALPVAISICAVGYISFRISMLAGIIALSICAVVAIAATVVVVHKLRKMNRKSDGEEKDE